MQPFYPPAAFYFRVTVIGGQAGPRSDSGFQDIAGLQAKMEVENVIEGGENRFAHRLPRYVTYPNLVMKRGLIPKGSGLADWVIATLGGGLALPVEPRNLKIDLMNNQHTPTLSWTVERAWPLRWEVSPLNSQDSKFLIETLELSYNYFFRS
jgi:phage tail-like protein